VSSTTFDSLAKSVCDYLAGISSLALTEGVNLFAGLQPDEPDQLVCVFERPGQKPLMTFVGPAGLTGPPQPQSLLDRPVIQLRVRGAMGALAATNTLMQQVFGALQGLANSNVPSPSGLFVLLFDAAGYPLYMGQDTRQRPEFSLNLQVMFQNTQRIPA